jgi:thiol-disulfide isomerase/thioredoxin
MFRTTTRFYLLLACLISFSYTMGQKASRVMFTVEDLLVQKVMLYSYYGDQRILMDSAVSDPKGSFQFQFGMNSIPGIYHVQTVKNDGIDFIFNGQDVMIKTNISFSPDSTIVEKSLENRILFEYLSNKIFFEQRLELLLPLIYYYPTDDPFYDKVEREFNRLEEDYMTYLEEIYDDYPDLIVTRFIRFDQLEDIRPGEISPERNRHLKQHYFDGIDLTDTLLLYSPLLPGRIIDYLSLFVTPGGGQQKQEELFMQAIDSLMQFTLPGSKVREVVVNYLIEGFQAYGLENVMTYLVENYVLDQSCVSEQREEVLKKRIEGFKKLAVGNFAPDFETRDITGETVKLSNLAYDVKILFFWSSDCPHCSDAIPELKRIGNEYQDVAHIISISVDSDESAWRQAISEKGMDWINIAELKGWDGEIVNDYFIYATPTILVLDQYLEILAKPGGVRELGLFMEKYTDRK